MIGLVPLWTLRGLTSLFAYCCAIWASTLLGKFIISSDVIEPLCTEERLELEAVPELSEFDELEAPIDVPEREFETPVLFTLSEGLDVVLAIGTETLLV